MATCAQVVKPAPSPTSFDAYLRNATPEAGTSDESAAAEAESKPNDDQVLPLVIEMLPLVIEMLFLKGSYGSWWKFWSIFANSRGGCGYNIGMSLQE